MIHEDRAILTINHGQDSKFSGTLVGVELDTGKELWRFDHEHFFAEPSISLDGFVYLTSFSGHVFKIDMHGQLCWGTRPSERNLWQGILNQDQFVYAEIAGQSNFTRAIDCQSGTVCWEFENGGHCYGLAASECSRFIVHSVGVTKKFGEWRYFLYCTNAETGKLVWQTEHNDILYCPAILGDFIFVGSRNHVAVFDLDNGRPIDSYNLTESSEVSQRPVVSSGEVVVASQRGHVASLLVKGEKRGLFRKLKPKLNVSWHLDLSAKIRSSVIGVEGQILVLTEDGKCQFVNTLSGAVEQTVKVPYFKEGYGLSPTQDGLLVAASRDCLRGRIR
ncbi:PQQ-binding-like beta-propeller repeat protein [Hyphomonas sp. FCG-A18]|uniref:outer membrane protein assembly factor BamB family protein n=1 Tax=Hyphomonas sp. FCG-A18 TaxID=3080019 RepID=UPI002B28CC62|nr:PQQ-binding-like beta-propeller repeat protein [Hyphomonas sp. FCG-A18]